MTPEVSILIVAYRSRGLIDACLDALSAGAAEVAHEILLIDNSPVGDPAAVAEHVAGRYPHVRVLPGAGNVGFGRANNLLAEQARAGLLLLVNPDVVVEPGAIEKLVEAACAWPEAAAFGGVTLDASGKPDTGNSIVVPGLRHLARALAGGRQIGAGAVSDGEVSMISGGFVLVRSDAFARVGGFDPRFFLYCEEVDLFCRLRVSGWRLRRVAAARAHHAIAHGDSLSPRRLLFMAAGTVEFLRKHRSPFVSMLGAFLIWLAAMERVTAGTLLGRWSPRLAALGRGYRMVSWQPGLWRHGYDPQRGLQVRLGTIAEDPS